MRAFLKGANCNYRYTEKEKKLYWEQQEYGIWIAYHLICNRLKLEFLYLNAIDKLLSSNLVNNSVLVYKYVISYQEGGVSPNSE